MLEIAFETFKEFLPSAGLGDEDVAAIGSSRTRRR